ncbi:Beta-lactamase [hydrothermal vent metagenome]|uniref:Beta-lactamase n=1 Tax=hydrothermal vent metagenome TaxID=652676 RepID=A0A3B1DXG3_9ZZZZ
MSTYRKLQVAVVAIAACGVVVSAHPVWTQPEVATETKAGPSLADRLSWIESEFEQARIEQHAPGAALAIVKDGEVVFTQGFGVADIESGQKVTPDTRFAVGSTTKAFTATVIGMLVDDGVMSYDAHVREYVPAFHMMDADADEQIVVRDLLCHRVGYAVMNATWYGVPNVTSEEIIEIMGQAELLYPFRERWNYSNESFLVAGVAAGNAAGSDWDSLIAERIFAPLGMNDSNTTYAAAQADPLMAKGYLWDAEAEEWEHQPMRKLDAIGPAGSINSSVRDMARWVQFQLGRGEIDGTRLLSEETLAETWTKHSEMSGDIGYGLGWMLRESEGRRVIEHAGGIDGFTAEVALLPDDGIGMVMLTNQFASPLQNLSRSIVFQGMLGDITKSDIPVADEDLSRYTGSYIANFGPFKNTEIPVLVQDGALAVDVPGQMVFALKAPDDEGKRYFTITDTIAIRFNENDMGEVYSMTFFQSGATFECFREGFEAPVEIDLAEAQDYLGVYHLEEADLNVPVILQNNRVAIDMPGQMVYELYPPDDEGWMVFRVTDTIRVRFDRDETGKVVSITQQQDGNEMVLMRVAEGDEAADRLPNVEQLLAWARQAGVIDTAGAIESLTLEGTVRAVHMGLRGPTRAVYAKDRRVYSRLDLGGGRVTETWATPEQGLTRSFALGDTDLTSRMLAAAWVLGPLAWAGDWQEAFDSVAVVGRQPFDGREVFALRVTLDKNEATLLLDTETHLPVAVETITEAAYGQMLPLTVKLSDWREVSGVKFAHRAEIEIPMAGSIVSEWSTIEANLPVEDSRFVPPQKMGE